MAVSKYCISCRERNTFLDFSHENDSLTHSRAASAGPAFATYPSACRFAHKNVTKYPDCQSPVAATVEVQEQVSAECVEISSRKRGGGVRKLRLACSPGGVVNRPEAPAQFIESTLRFGLCGDLPDPLGEYTDAKNSKSKVRLLLSQLCPPAPRNEDSRKNPLKQEPFKATAGHHQQNEAKMASTPPSTHLERSSTVVRPDKQNKECEADVTTAMIRHIACRYTRKQVAEFLDGIGLKGAYNSIHLPMNKQKTANLGYVFVSFLSPSHFQQCCRLLDNQVFGPSGTKKRCEVTPAALQGSKRSRKRIKDALSEKCLVDDSAATEQPKEHDISVELFDMESAIHDVGTCSSCLDDSGSSTSCHHDDASTADDMEFQSEGDGKRRQSVLEIEGYTTVAPCSQQHTNEVGARRLIANGRGKGRGSRGC